MSDNGRPYEDIPLFEMREPIHTFNEKGEFQDILIFDIKNKPSMDDMVTITQAAADYVATIDDGRHVTMVMNLSNLTDKQVVSLPRHPGEGFDKEIERIEEKLKENDYDGEKGIASYKTFTMHTGFLSGALIAMGLWVSKDATRDTLLETTSHANNMDELRNKAKKQVRTKRSLSES